MTPRVLRTARLALVLVATPAIAHAQNPPRLDAGSATIGAGYARLSWDGCCANGIMVDFGSDVFKRESYAIALVADFSRTKFSDDTETEIDRTYTGGARLLFFRGRRINGFAQGTAGVVDFTEEDVLAAETGTQPLVGAGIGFLFNLNEYLAFRLQGDFWRTRSGDTWEGVRRFSIGAVFRFGGR